eukprot:s595_g15.t1
MIAQTLSIFQYPSNSRGTWRWVSPGHAKVTMGTCTSTPRLHPTFRGFVASSRSSDALGEDWYLDTMNLLLDRWAPSHVQFLRKKFLEATGEGEEELDKKGFYSLFAELQDLPSSVSESAFRMFDADGSGKLNFKEFCCALALCCQLMSSDDEKIRFVFDMFDTNDDGLLSSLEVEQLVEHSLREEEKYLPAEEHLRQAAMLGQWPSVAASSDIPSALAEWGIQDKYTILLSHECIFLLDADSDLELWIYVPDQVDTPAEKIFHRSHKTMTDRDHMRVLHAHGHCKAVVLRFEQPSDRIHYVFYVNVVADPPERPGRNRQKTAWATPQPTPAAPALLYDCSAIDDHRPACRLDLGITGDALHRLFSSAIDILHKDVQGIDLPDICQTLLDECVDHGHIDRLVIYADGSSQAHHRRKPPQWIDEFDVNDSWCFAVFGENYQSDRLMFLGLQCQQIIYDPDAPHYTGTEHIGADAAEREALLWAGLWRLSQNHRLPTLFRTDSSLTKGQALGEIGTSQDHAPLRLLRATFQALDAVLPNDCLRVEHVMGHAGDALNELVDFFAKREATQSLYLPRQQIDLRTWTPVLPHLWMILTESPDVPVFTAHGFDIGAPHLPSEDITAETVEQHVETMSQITLSVCSANVRSLHSRPQGHAGKLDYLRQQMKQLHINVVGLQETRTPAGSSCADDIFRLSSGDSHGHFGVEFWVNLSQPIAQVHGRSILFQREDFVVVHASPRILLVLHDHVLLRMWFLVAHGPQSGRDADEREDWWHGLSALVFQHVQSDPLYVMIDANASTGMQDGVHVFDNDDTPSITTPLLRDFLKTHELCIPATGSMHEGPTSTWTSPIDGSEHRIDYVLIRQSSLPSCRLSQVLPEFDLGHHGDHEAVILQLTWPQLWRSPRRDPKPPRGSYQRDKISRAGLHVPLREYTPLPWETDIDTQVHHFNGYLRDTLGHHCRPSKKEPKKSHISAEIWQRRADRLQAKRHMQQTQRLMRRELLARLFSEWKCGCNPTQGEQIQFYTSLMCSKLRLYAKLRTFGRQLRLQLQHAKGQVLDQRLKDMPPDAPASSVLHELKTIIGSTNRRKQQRPPLPMIVCADGQPCHTVKQLRECWIQFFQHMECGQRLDSEALRRIWSQNLRRFQQEQVDLSASDIPSLYDLEAAFRCVKNNKATGQDGVPSEVCHAYPAALARMVYTQLLKLCTHGQEALVHKGGQLVMAYKNKGAQSNPASYRSLMISSHIAKTLHRCLRSKQATYYERYLQTQQIGGRRRVPVQLGVHMVRAHLRAQIQQRKSVAVIFLDLQEAFYRVMRPLSVGEPMTDDALAAMLQRLNMPSSAIEELMQLLEAPCATAAARLPAHLQLALQATHTDTHLFFIAGQSDHVRTQAGSRPGDPFADVVFGFLFSRILTTLEQSLQEHDLLGTLPLGSPACLFGGTSDASPGAEDADPRPFMGPTWMDDLAICIAADTASSLEQKAAATTGILLEVCLAHGVTPNVSKGKTEILLSLRGLGSRAMRRKYFSQQQGQVMQILHEHGTQSVAVVGSYTHLGGKAHHSGECKVEARRRISIANEAFTQYRRQLFQNRHIAVDRRRELFSTLVLSKLTYGMETWVFEQKEITDYVYAAILRLYKHVLKIPATQHVDDQELLAQVGLPSPKTLFRGARLRYLLMLISCETVVPWGLFDQDTRWRDLVRADLRWLWHYVKDTSTLQDPDQHPQDWLYTLRYHGKYWKTLVRRAIKLDILKHRDQWQLRHIHAGVFAQLQDTGSLHLPAPQVPEPALQDHHGCLCCRKRCRTRAGEAAHMFKVHGIVAEFRHMSDSTSCPACLREYHTVDRLHAHLRRASHCQARLRGLKIWRPVTPGIGSRYNAQLRREHDGLLPFQPAEGPSFAPGPLLEALNYHLETYEKLAQLCFDDGHRGLRFLQAQGRDLISQQVISWTMLLHTLDRFQQDFTDEDCELASLSPDDKRCLIHHLRDPGTWPFLHGAVCAADSKHHIEALETYEHWCDQLAALQDAEVWQADVTRPQAVFREKIVLHAYSGRRRHGDFQWFLDACAQAHPDAIIHVVSVDIVIDTDLGDIGKEAVREMWYEGMRQGYVAGFLSGPPCCTWSVARGKPTNQAGRRGPRILRDVCHLWGFTSVSLREMEQLFDGHQLLGFSATSMAILATTNALGLLEHPAEPAAPDAASIWRVPLLKLLSRLPGMCRFPMAQGLLGAPSPKPTDLLALNLPSLPRHFVQWALCKDLPKGRSIGTNAAGEYHTAGLKEYPPAMCAAIAQAFFDQLQQPQALGTAEPRVPPEFLDRCKSLIVTDMGTAFGPDFEVQKRSWSRISQLKQELLGTTSQPLSYDRFYEWALRNMGSLNNLLCTFQLVPAPQRERAVCEDIMLRNPVLQEGCTWYCISHKWLQVWKSYTGWSLPTRRRVASSHALNAPEPVRDRERCFSGDSGVSLPLFGANVAARTDELWGERAGGYQILPARPPEIDNSDLEGEHKGELKMNLVEHLDFDLIPEEMWLRLVEWYGGGPALPRKVICMGRDHHMQVELYPALVLVVVAGNDGKPVPQFSRRFFISKQSTLDQTLLMLAEKLSKPVERSRLWHRSKGEQWRLVPNPLLTMDEFLEGKGWDAGAFLLETMTEDSEWPRDRPVDTEAEDLTEEAQVAQSFEVGDRVEAQGAGTGQWLRGTIVDVVLRQTATSATPSQVKVHFDSTVYKSDEWINTQRLAPLGTHTVDPDNERDGQSVSTECVPGATGLHNLGNTCFMNATLQCLANTPLLREYFLCSQHLRESSERSKSTSKGKLAQEFGSVFLELWSAKSSVVSPRDLKRTIDQFAPQFAGYEQHDAQELWKEFMDFLLEGLHDDLNRRARSFSSKGSSRAGLKSKTRKEPGAPSSTLWTCWDLLGLAVTGQKMKGHGVCWERTLSLKLVLWSQDMHLCSCFRSSSAVTPDETYDSASGRDAVSLESEEASDRPGHLLRGISSLYFADSFIKEVTSAGHDRNASVREVEADVIRKKGESILCPRDARPGTSYVDAICGPAAAKSEFMLSYSWGYGVGSIADTLTDFLGSDEHKYVWICCLCINQHRVKEAQAAGHVVPFEIFRTAFSQRVEGVSHILAMMSPWQHPLYIQRVWCVYEFSHAIMENKELSVLMPPDETTDFASEKDAFRSALFASGRGLRELFEGLSKLRIQDAQASVQKDKEHIMQTIDKAAEDFNKSPKVAALNQSVKEKLQAWFIATAAAWLEKKISSGDSVEWSIYNSVAEMLMEAVADFERAEHILKVGMKQHGHDGPVAAISIRLLGRMSIRKGDYRGAEQHYTHAMALLDACNESMSVQYAQLLIDQFVATGESVLLNRAKQLFEDLNETSCEDYARLLKHMGTVHLGAGDLMQAMKFYALSRSHYEKGQLRQSPGFADLMVNMGRLEVTLEDNWKALEAFEEARRIYQAIGVTTSPGYADLLLNMGHLQAEKLERPDTAMTSFREACDVYDAAGASGLAVAQARVAVRCDDGAAKRRTPRKHMGVPRRSMKPAVKWRGRSTRKPWRSRFRGNSLR